MVEGPPNWTSFRDFWKMFYDEGAVVVASTYSKVGGVYDFGFRHDPDHPLESLAEYALGCYTNLNFPQRTWPVSTGEDQYRRGLYTHWQGHLSALRYTHAPKHEYFAVRNGVGVFDTSPLFKYRITGPDAVDFLSGVVVRDRAAGTPRQISAERGPPTVTVGPWPLRSLPAPSSARSRSSGRPRATLIVR